MFVILMAIQLLLPQDKQIEAENIQRFMINRPDINQFDSTSLYLQAHAKFIEDALNIIRHTPEDQLPEGIRKGQWGRVSIEGRFHPELYSIPAKLKALADTQDPKARQVVKRDLVKRGLPIEEVDLLDFDFSAISKKAEHQAKTQELMALGEKMHELDDQTLKQAVIEREALSNEIERDAFSAFFQRFSEKARRVLISYAKEKVDQSTIVLKGPPSDEYIKWLRKMGKNAKGGQ